MDPLAQQPQVAPAPHAPVLSRYDLAARLMMDPAATDDVLRLPPEAVDAAVGVTQRGAFLLKFGRSGRPQKRFVRVTDEGDALFWVSRRKKRADSTLLLATVERLQRGQHTSVFARHARDFGHLSPLCLSIVAAGGFRSLDLAFESPAQLEAWTVALTALLLRQRAATDDGDTKQLWRAFVAEDVDGSGAITYHQCKALLRRLNIYQQKRRLKALYRHVLLTVPALPPPPPPPPPPPATAAAPPPASLSFMSSSPWSSSPSASLLSSPSASGDAPGGDQRGAAGDAPGGVVHADGGGDGERGGGGAGAPDGSSGGCGPHSHAHSATTAAAAPPPLPAAALASDATLTFQSVMRLVDLLRDRPDVSAVYHALVQREQHAAPPSGVDAAGSQRSTMSMTAANATTMMPLAVFHSFLQHDQKETGTTLEAARRLALHYDPAHGASHISLAAFTAFLTSAGNSAYAPEATRADYHDMTSHPLSAYFIESSHNTYLEGDQLQSPASVSAYISVVQKGARCVELDCWDGPAGEPVIYHGRTLTGRIPFADVCRALRDFGFVASPYPLILSLEMHCGPKQQERIAAVLLETFGAALAAPLSEPAAGGGGGLRAAHAGAGGSSSRTRSLSVASSVSSVGSTGGSDASVIRPSSQSGFSASSSNTSTARQLLADDGGASLASWTDTSGGELAEGGLQHRPPLICMDINALPSPAALMRKVVVKAKVARKRQPPPLPPPVPLMPPSLSALAAPDASPSPRGDALATSAGAAAPPSLLLSTPARRQPLSLDPSTPSHAQAASAVAAPSALQSTSPVAAGSASLSPGAGGPAAMGAVDASVMSSSLASRSRAGSVTVAGSGSGSGSGGGVGSSILRRLSRKLSVGTAGDPTAAAGSADATEPASPAGPTAARGVDPSQATLPTGIEPATMSKPLLVPALRALVMLAAVPFESLEHSAAAGERTWVMHSLKEPKAARLLARPGGASALLLHTSRQLLRVYPGPLRVDSSNFHGGPFWAAGVQMVALNHQTHDVPMRVARAFFRLNGRCGFVLKPAYMRDADAIAALSVPPGSSAATAGAGSGGSGGGGTGSGGATGDSTSFSAAADTAAMKSAGGRRTPGHTADPLVDASPLPLPPPPPREHSELLRAAAPRLTLRMYEASPRVVLLAGGGTTAAPDAFGAPVRVEVASQALPPDAALPIGNDGGGRGGSCGSSGGVSSSSDGGDGSVSAGGDGGAVAQSPLLPLPASSDGVALCALPPDVAVALSPPSPLPPRAFSLGALKRTLSGTWLQQQLQHHPGIGRSPLLLQQPRDHDAPGSPDAFTLLVTVMGAQHLPKRGGASESAAVPSPFCTVGVHGDPADRVKFASHVVGDNGFNPVWSAQFRLPLTRPELAVLYIGVHDQLDVARKAFLAFFAVPVAALRPGYRSCQLRGAQGKKIPFCSLLCRFQRRPL